MSLARIPVLPIAILSVGVLAAPAGNAQPPATPAGATPLALAPPAEELATYMSQLQMYTHKLSLSVEARNADLAGFYLHESQALLEKMQERLPEYEGVPVALYIDRMALPTIAALGEQLAAGRAPDWTAAEAAMEGVVNGCNSCHQASRRGYIRIRRSSSNPYLQDFTPE